MSGLGKGGELLLLISGGGGGRGGGGGGGEVRLTPKGKRVPLQPKVCV